MIVVDVETTGLRPEKNSIVSIGALDFSNPKNQFYKECRIWEGAEISDQALEINGFTKDEITSFNKPSLEETIKEFFSWVFKIEDITIAGENPGFDRDFLNNSFKRAGLDFYFGHRAVDLHSICYGHHIKYGKAIPLVKNMTGLNLDKTLNYIGLFSEPKPHNALTGAKMEAEAFSRFFFGKVLFEEYSEYFVPYQKLNK